jgi:hypothetical protein
MTGGKSLQCQMVRVRVSQCPTGVWLYHHGSDKCVRAMFFSIFEKPHNFFVTAQFFVDTVNKNNTKTIFISSPQELIRDNLFSLLQKL